MDWRRRLCGGPVILVDTLHVVKEVVATREPVTRHGTLTIAEVAQVWPGSVTVHAMCLTLVTEEACSRRELHANARLLVAAERLQMRVHVLAVEGVSSCCDMICVMGE